jgi:hypothetical protein
VLHWAKMDVKIWQSLVEMTHLDVVWRSGERQVWPGPKAAKKLHYDQSHPPSTLSPPLLANGSQCGSVNAGTSCVVSTIRAQGLCFLVGADAALLACTDNSTTCQNAQETAKWEPMMDGHNES